MARTVAIIGNKGGTGKTTLSHMISHGFGLFGRRTVAVLTDSEREKLSKIGRCYLPFDARSPRDFGLVMAKLKAVNDWYGVIDGGGNRPEVDRQIASAADLILLPFRDSHEDMRSLLRDLERYPNAYALPSQWPTNPWQQASAWRSVDQLLGDYRDRILEPAYAISSSKLLLQSRIPESLPSILNNACRLMAIQIIELWGDRLPEGVWNKPVSVSPNDDGQGQVAAVA